MLQAHRHQGMSAEYHYTSPLGDVVVCLFHVLCVVLAAAAKQHQPPHQQLTSSPGRVVSVLKRQPRCCFSTTTSTSSALLSSSRRRCFISLASSSKSATAGAAQTHASHRHSPIAATSFFFQRRLRSSKLPFLHIGQSFSQYAPGDVYSWHNNRVLHNRGGDSGGAVTTTVMSSSAALVTEESSANSKSSDSGVETSNNDIHDDDAHNDNDDDDKDKEAKLILIHSYTYNSSSPSKDDYDGFNLNNTATTLMGLGIPKRRFATWVQYYLRSNSQNDDALSSSATSTTTNTNSDTASLLVDEIISNITTQQIHWENDWETHIKSLRQYWKEGRLLCEHTNLLNDRGGFSSRRLHNSERKKKKKMKKKRQEGGMINGNMNQDDENDEDDDDDEEERQIKYEQFKNILASYADRLVHIIEDELSDVRYIPHHNVEMTIDVANSSISTTTSVINRSSNNNNNNNNNNNKFNHYHPELLLLPSPPRWDTRLGLRGWIEKEYGVENTRALLANELLVKSEKEQLETFQAFLDFFRVKFPYFHDACDMCGASCKYDPLSEKERDNDHVAKTADSANGEVLDSNDVNAAQEEIIDAEIMESREEGDAIKDDDNEDNDNFSFVGYIGPSPVERLGNASRTELYRCRSCFAFTRFPRYNKALWVTHTRRGRCGEYSMLLYRMLRALGYEKTRWVVDWADHVWVEVLLGDSIGVVNNNSAMAEVKGRWVHLDPCEAAVDNPLLYSSWGKNQTYLMAFYDPSGMTFDGLDLIINAVEDVTLRYTNDDVDVVTERRGISEHSVAEAIEEVSIKMISSLNSVVASSTSVSSR